MWGCGLKEGGVMLNVREREDKTDKKGKHADMLPVREREDKTVNLLVLCARSHLHHFSFPSKTN